MTASVLGIRIWQTEGNKCERLKGWDNMIVKGKPGGMNCDDLGWNELCMGKRVAMGNSIYIEINPKLAWNQRLHNAVV